MELFPEVYEEVLAEEEVEVVQEILTEIVKIKTLPNRKTKTVTVRDHEEFLAVQNELKRNGGLRARCGKTEKEVCNGVE